MNSIKISIIIAIYNVEKMLKRCLDSIVSQDYPNIEIILVNDGSTDNSLGICKKYKEEDTRIVLINKKNGGVSSARNAGIEKATGDIVLFVDSDDWVSTNLCSDIAHIFSNNEIDIVIFGFNIIQGKKTKAICTQKDRLITKEKAIEGLLIDKAIRNYPWNKAYKSELFKNVRYPEVRTFEDVAATFKLFDNASCFYITKKCLYNYEIRNNSLSTKWWKSEEKVIDYFDAREAQFCCIKEKYPTLIKKASASIGFAALMGVSYLNKQDSAKIVDFLYKEKTSLLNSSFPFSILISLYYKNPHFIVKIIRKYFG